MTGTESSTMLGGLNDEKTDSKKISSKKAEAEEKNGDNYYTILNEAFCSAEFPSGGIFSDET